MLAVFCFFFVRFLLSCVNCNSNLVIDWATWLKTKDYTRICNESKLLWYQQIIYLDVQVEDGECTRACRQSGGSAQWKESRGKGCLQCPARVNILTLLLTCQPSITTKGSRRRELQTLAVFLSVVDGAECQPRGTVRWELGRSFGVEGDYIALWWW